MAKLKSIFKPQGTIGGLTTVRSKTYGEHVRSARGSKSAAEVNNAFKKSSSEMMSGNVPARLIKNTIDLHRQDFIGGQLWQKLVGIFKKQVKDQQPFSVKDLQNIEVHDLYPISRFLKGLLQYDLSITKNAIVLNLSFNEHPDFKRKYVDGYRVGVICIFPDFINDQADSLIVYSPVINLSSVYKPLSFEIPCPETAVQFLLCLKIEGCEKGEVCTGLSPKGMRIIAARDLRE